MASNKNEWGKENLRTLSCRVRIEDAEKFKQYAAYVGKTTHALLQEYVNKCIDLNKEVTVAQRSAVERLQVEVDMLRRKLKVAEAEVQQARSRAVNAEALVDKWLRSADEK